MSTLLQLAQQTGTPLIEGHLATFVWQGDTPPPLIGDFNDWQGDSTVWQKGSDEVWIYQLELPLDAYIEYAFGSDAERILDPFNARLTPNGMGKHNHYFYMPAGKATPLSKRGRGIAAGQVSQYDLPTFNLVVGKERRVWLYQPPTDKPVPLVLVYDGRSYLRRAKLPVIVDNLIAQKRIQPIALALVENGKSARMAEYGCSEATLAFVLQQVLPLAQQQLTLTQGPYGVLGASMGGLMSLYTAWRLPELFNRVLSQSGAFHLGGYPLVINELVERGKKRPLRIWLDVGRYEWLLPSSQAMHQLLQEKAYPVGYHEFNGGHNYPAWRDNVWRGLEWLFPPTSKG